MERKHRDLLVWREAIELASLVYSATATFPKSEVYGLVSQLRRASVSIAANIAEGAGRNSRRELTQFIGIAVGSVSELDTLVELANRLGYIEEKQLLQEKVDRVHALLTALRKRLRTG
jgi:four helix bundle protein